MQEKVSNFNKEINCNYETMPVYARLLDIQSELNIETDEEIESVSPGRAGQKVKMKLPIKCMLWITCALLYFKSYRE